MFEPVCKCRSRQEYHLDADAKVRVASIRDQCQTLAHLLVGRVPTRPVGGEAEWTELTALAGAEGVGPLLDRALCAFPDVDVPPGIRESLASMYAAAAFWSMLQESVRTRLCRRLEERRIPTLLLKGAALAYTSYDDPAVRPMVDLDLLVPAWGLEEAACSIEEEGFRLPTGSRAAQMRSPRGHLVYAHPVTGAMVEIHWELKVLGRMQGKALPEIWSGARAAESLGGARVMRPGHAVPLLCAHMILQHQHAKLLWLFDLHQILRAIDSEEAELVWDAATRWRLAPCTALTLLHVEKLFGTVLPGNLSTWAAKMASGDCLQGWLASRILANETAEMPDADLLDLVMDRNRSLLGAMLPTPGVLRERLGLTPDQNIAPAYAAFIAQRLRNSPSRLRRLWCCWRSAIRTRVSGTDAIPRSAAVRGESPKSRQQR